MCFYSAISPSAGRSPPLHLFSRKVVGISFFSRGPSYLTGIQIKMFVYLLEDALVLHLPLHNLLEHAWHCFLSAALSTSNILPNVDSLTKAYDYGQISSALMSAYTALNKLFRWITHRPYLDRLYLPGLRNKGNGIFLMCHLFTSSLVGKNWLLPPSALNGHSGKVFKPKPKRFLASTYFPHWVVPIWKALPEEITSYLRGDSTREIGDPGRTSGLILQVSLDQPGTNQ